MLRARCDSCRSRRRPSRVCRVAPWGDSPRCPRAVLGCPPAEPVLDPMRTCSRLRSAALPLGATVRGALERSSGAPPPSRCSTRCEPRAVERDTKGRAPSRNGDAEQDRARFAARAVVRTTEKRRDEAARASTVPARRGVPAPRRRQRSLDAAGTETAGVRGAARGKSRCRRTTSRRRGASEGGRSSHGKPDRKATVLTRECVRLRAVGAHVERDSECRERRERRSSLKLRRYSFTTSCATGVTRVNRDGGRLKSAALPLGATVRGALERSSGAPPPSRCSTRCVPAAVSGLPRCPLGRQSEVPLSGPRVPPRRAGARPDASRVPSNETPRVARHRGMVVRSKTARVRPLVP